MTRVLLDVPHTVAGHCGSGTLRDLLAWAGLGYDGEPVSEALTFALSGGLAFQYLRFLVDTPPIYLVGRTGGLEVAACHRLGIDVEVRRTDDPDAGWELVAGELDAGRPVMIHADILELPYLHVRVSNTRHALVVAGYDDVAGVAYVVDNDRAEVQEVELEALDRARSSDGFPDPPRYATFPMRFPPALPDLRTAARSACADVVRNLELGAGLFPDTALAGAELSVTGTAGVEVLAGDVAGWGQVFDDERRQAAFQALRLFIEKAGTGTGMFRRLQADGLLEAGERTADPELVAAGDAWTAVADAWSALSEATREGTAAAAAAAAALPALERAALDATRRAAG